MSLLKYLISILILPLLIAGIAIGFIWWPFYSGFMEASNILIKTKEMK